MTRKTWNQMYDEIVPIVEGQHSDELLPLFTSLVAGLLIQMNHKNHDSAMNDADEFGKQLRHYICQRPFPGARKSN